MTTACMSYDEWAWLYDRTMGPDYGCAQLALLETVLLPRLPARAAILDLCCGTGQLIAPLLAAGHRVTALDGSSDMLACAQRNAPDARFVHADARDFREPEAFDGAFSTSASLNHLETLADLTKVFENVYASLKPGGAFVFDLNHPAQLAKWWRGRPTEGEIADDYAWLVVPQYAADSGAGVFTVTIYKAGAKSRGLAAGLRRGLYRLLARPRFIGLRLQALLRFAALEPDWQRQQLDFPVRGHALDAVRAALQTVGFADVRICAIDGSSDVDANHSAHFVCVKPEAHSP